MTDANESNETTGEAWKFLDTAVESVPTPFGNGSLARLPYALYPAVADVMDAYKDAALAAARDQIQRLEREVEILGGANTIAATHAAELERQRNAAERQRDELRAALTPWSGIRILDGAPDDGWLATWADLDTLPTVAAVRRAAALSATAPEKPETKE